MSYQLFTISAPNIEMNETNVEDLLDTINERRRLTEQYRQQMDEQVQEFVNDAVGQIRGRVIEALKALRASFTREKCVTERTMNSVRRTIEQFKALNFMGDKRVNDMLTEFEQGYMQRNAQEYRDNASLLETFSQATDEALQSARAGRYIRRLNLDN